MNRVNFMLSSLLWGVAAFSFIMLYFFDIKEIIISKTISWDLSNALMVFGILAVVHTFLIIINYIDRAE